MYLFLAVLGLSLVAASGGYSLLRCVGFSLQWPLLLQSTDSRVRAQWLLPMHGLSCSEARGIFLEQGF